MYVVPPNRRLEINDGMLTLSEMTQREHRRSPWTSSSALSPTIRVAVGVRDSLGNAAPTDRPASSA